MELFNTPLTTCPIALGAKESPNAPALKENVNLYTYKDLDHLINRYCMAIQELGFIKETIVAFQANRDTKTIAFLFAVIRLKMIACPLNPKLPETALHGQLLPLDNAVFLNPNELALGTSECVHGELENNKTSFLLFTSGSSSLPKIAAFSMINILYSARGLTDSLPLDEKSRWLLSLPLFHVGGLGILFRCFQAQASVVISQEKLEHCIEQDSITHLSLVPTQLYRLPNKEYPSLEAILLGGAPIPESLFQEHSNTKPLFLTYGMTEMSSAVTLKQKCTSKFHLGKCLPYRKLKISPDGEILVKGETLFQGYWKKNKIELPIDQEGFFATSDLGELKDDNLVFHGRKDLMFISGGENIMPEEIEKYIYAIEGVEIAIVVPVPNEEFGMRPVAFIQKEILNSNEIRKKLEDILPKFKVPTHFFTIPKTYGLKPSRTHLKKLAEEYLNIR